MKILNDNVLVGDIQPMATMAGDLFLPDSSVRYGDEAAISGRRYDAEIGTVMGVGKDAVGLKEGDKVYVYPMKGKEYKDMKLYRYEEILGIIEN